MLEKFCIVCTAVIKAGGGFIDENQIWWDFIRISLEVIVYLCQNKSKYITVTKNMSF